MQQRLSVYWLSMQSSVTFNFSSPEICPCDAAYCQSSLTTCYHCTVFTAPKISDLSVTSCVVDWTPLKPLGADSLVYVLQLQRISSRDPDYHEVSVAVIMVFCLYNASNCKSAIVTATTLHPGQPGKPASER